ncbi:MAG TPA: type II secretion system protein [Candidatus Sulfotelmatobacter sp.]|nr:type II secretion system protein [Candidatus Sulfotelmatobacter sp.]
MRLKSNRGFSLLELMITMLILLIMAGVTFIAMGPVIKQNDVTNAYDTTLEVIRTYRNAAITRSRRYMITFTPAVGATPATMTVQWLGVGVPVNPPPVTVATYTLPTDIQFAVLPGFPTAVASVPDGFGAGAVPIDFDQFVPPGGLNYVMFMPDGSSQDTLGNWNSGIVYMTRATDLWSGRAVTVFGPTGRIRGWRLNNVGGVATWGQQ